MKHTDTPIKAYKVTDKNMQCRGFLFEIGKEYRSDDPIRCGNRGFHSCLMAIDCFDYYDFDPTNRVFEVEFWGDYDDDKDDSKVSSQYIRLVKELTWNDVLDLVNSGKYNSGFKNTGNHNAGSRNTGHCNAGSHNAGNCNAGSHNAGNYNTGHCNSGGFNSGNYNTGHCNSGDYNAANYSSGFFNTVESDVIMFNKPTGLKRDQIILPLFNIIVNEWVRYTNEEMESDPNKALIGGYLKVYSYKEAWANWYKTASEKMVNEIRALPNFDSEVFFEITGLKI